MSLEDGFVRVASVSDIAPGKAIAVRVEDRSVALFNHQDQIYATDNQCPHMGYPLIRGRTRNGVLQCDWHGWSYDMAGGGCFTGGCDDLDTFPVEVQGDDIYVKVAGVASKRTGAHYLLLKEGLLSRDDWVLSKAVAIMLAQGVSEDETLRLIVTHLGKHIATEQDANGSWRLVKVANGISVARRLPGEDRLIPLMMAAKGASGRAGDRPERKALPPHASWETLANWVRMFSLDRDWEGIEKCLITARALGQNDDQIFPLAFECILEPHFIGFGFNIPHLVRLAEVLEAFGWDDTENLVCNLVAKMLGRHRGTPDGVRREAIEAYRNTLSFLDEITEPDGAVEFDEDKFVMALLSGELGTVFGAVSDALQSGVHVNQIADAMVMSAADRMSRTPASYNPGWWDLGAEMQMGSAIRGVAKYGGYALAAKAVYHAAWQFYGDRWLNIPNRPLSEITLDRNDQAKPSDASAERKAIVDAIESIQINNVGPLVAKYLAAGHPTSELLNETALALLKHDTGWDILDTLRVVYDESDRCRDHPASHQLIVGLARFTTGARRSNNSESATRTAKRFAQRQTAVDLY